MALSWRELMAEDPFVAKWLDARPEATQKHWAVYVKRFCDASSVSPEAFVKLPAKEARRLVWDHIHPVSQRYPAKAIGIRVALQSLYRFGTEGDVLTFDSRRGGAHHIKCVRNGDGHIPSRQEVYRLSECAGDLKGTAIVLVLFQSGLRPNALCRLDYEDVAEGLTEGRVPLRLKVTADMDSKLMSYELAYYYTWLGAEAVEALRRYVAYEGARIAWTEETPLFHSRRGKRYTSGELYWLMRRWIRKAGLSAKRTSLYDLRKAFYNVLVKTPMSDPNFKEALMGHKLAGSRGNYFDHHDLATLEQEYLRANFTRASTLPSDTRLHELEDEVRKLQQTQTAAQHLVELLADPAVAPKFEAWLRRLAITVEL